MTATEGFEKLDLRVGELEYLVNTLSPVVIEIAEKYGTKDPKNMGKLYAQSAAMFWATVECIGYGGDIMRDYFADQTKEWIKIMHKMLNEIGDDDSFYELIKKARKK